MKKRIIIDIFLLLGIFIFGPILAMVASLFFLYYLESFYEIIIVGLIIDVLYSSPVASFHNFSHPALFISVVLFAFSIFIKGRFKFY